MAGRSLYSDILIYSGHTALLLALVAGRPFPLKGYTGCPSEQVLLKGPGTISSPGYPSHYPADTRCTWLIKAPKNSWITLRFSAFDVKSGPTCDVPRCQCDYVQIRSYKQYRHRYSKKFCEGHSPVSVISLTSNKVQVHFRSNSFAEGNGFVLKYWFEKRPSTNIKSRSAKHDSPSLHKMPIKLSSNVKDDVTSHKVRRSASNTSGVVVTYHEDKEKAKKQEEEADPPDEIVLGPSIPIILIFLGVVASIAWWQFRSDQKERLRYEEISKRTKNRYKKKKKQSLREIRMKKLYGDMARHWQGSQGTSGGGGGSPNIRSSTKRSFAGRLLELAEKPVSYIRTPRGSRPSSVVVQEQEIPLVVMREKKDVPAGHHPPSRPASVLLRDALNMIFGATAPSVETGDTSKEPGSESDSKRASLKRVSFYDSLVEKMADVKEDEETATAKPVDKPSVKQKPPPLLIPHIMVRQPSCDAGDGDVEMQKKSPTIRGITVSSISKKNKPTTTVDKKDEPRPSEAEIKPEESSTEQAAPTVEPPSDVDGQEPGKESDRPRSFEKKLVEMLEVLKTEEDEFKDNDENDIGERFSRDDLGEPSPPPVPRQTPVPRDSASSMPPEGKTNCADLEDFLLNLDKELENDDER